MRYFDYDGQPGRGPDAALFPTELLMPTDGTWKATARKHGGHADVISKAEAKDLAGTWLAHHGAKLPEDLV